MAHRHQNPPMYYILEPGMSCSADLRPRLPPSPAPLDPPSLPPPPLKSLSEVLQTSYFASVRPSARKNTDDYVKETSAGIRFDDEVIRDQTFRVMMFYDPNYLGGTGDALCKKRKSLPSRNERWRQNLSTVQPPLPAKLDPLVPGKSGPKAKRRGLARTELKSRKTSTMTSAENNEKTGALPAEKASGAEKKADSGVKVSQWDEYLLTKLSGNAANWVVRTKMPPGEDRDRLTKFLHLHRGSVDDDAGKELVEDSVSEVDFALKPSPQNQGRYRSDDEIMLSKVRAIVQRPERVYLTLQDDAIRPFYVPSSVPDLKSRENLDDVKTVLNQTAENITVEPYHLPSSPTLRDILNRKVGDKIYDSKDQFVQDWLTGGKPVHQSDSLKIKMDSDNSYRKNLRRNVPHLSTEWLTDNKENDANLKVEHDHFVSAKYRKGFQRWERLPSKIEHNLSRPQQNEFSDESISRQKPVHQLQTETKSTMAEILNEWRSHLRLNLHDSEMTLDDLIKEMGNIHVSTRLGAIVTCSKAVEEHQTSGRKGGGGEGGAVPEELFVALVLCLKDSSERVRTAVAILLFVLERPLLEAEQVLRRALLGSHPLDRWTAARCLAHFGGCDFDIVGELVDQLFNSEDEDRRCQAMDHLVRLSRLSTLVHSMVSERLNSCSWKQRLTACKTISVLQGDINKDLVGKLCHMMWSDWNGKVRRAAALALGRTGHAVDIHHQLVDKLLNGDLRTRLAAISTLGDAGIMTGKLFPIFMGFFDDENSSVRMEACVALMNLCLMSDEIQAKLISLAANDRVWKVRALAIQALGRSGSETEKLRKALLWSFCYDTEEGVRAEACHTVTSLRLKGNDIGQILQDRYLVEKSDLVKKEIVLAFAAYGISPTQEIPILTQIKAEVRRLGTSENIKFSILANEIEENHEDNVKRMICLEPENEKSHATAIQPPESTHRRLRVSFAIVEPSNDHLSVAGTDGSDEHSICRSEEEKEVVASHVEASVPSFIKNSEFPMESGEGLSQRRSRDKAVPRGGIGSTRHLDLEVDERRSCSAVISREMSTQKNDSDDLSGRHVGLESTANRSLMSIEGKVLEKVDHSADGKDLRNDFATAKEQSNITEIQSHELSDIDSDDDSFIY